MTPTEALRARAAELIHDWGVAGVITAQRWSRAHGHYGSARPMGRELSRARRDIGDLVAAGILVQVRLDRRDHDGALVGWRLTEHVTAGQ